MKVRFGRSRKKHSVQQCAITCCSHFFPKEDIRSRPYYYADADRQIYGAVNESSSCQESARFSIFNSTGRWVSIITVWPALLSRRWLIRCVRFRSHLRRTIMVRYIALCNFTDQGKVTKCDVSHHDCSP